MLGIKTSAEIMSAAEAKANEIIGQVRKGVAPRRARMRKRGWGTLLVGPSLLLFGLVYLYPGRLLGVRERLRVGPHDAHRATWPCTTIASWPRPEFWEVIVNTARVLGWAWSASASAWGCVLALALNNRTRLERAAPGVRSSARTSSPGSPSRSSGSGCSIRSTASSTYLLPAGRAPAGELARRPSHRALDAGARDGVEDGRLPAGDLPRRTPGHSG